MHKAHAITRDSSYIEFEYRFRKGDVVNFLYITDDGRKTFIRNSRICNSWFEDPILYESIMGNEHQEYRCYYFCNPSDSVQGVWIPEAQVFDRNDTLAETLYGG